MLREVFVSERRVRLFRNGRNQAVRIPRGFELPGKNAVIRKDGEELIVEPVSPKSLLEVLASLAPLGEEFAEIPDTSPRAVEL
jgi:antitoxin VapB